LASASRPISEYGGRRVSTGAICWIRWSCATLKLETPMGRTKPRSLRSANAVQPSSTSSSGIGQWIWYRSMASSPSRFRLASASHDRVALQVVHHGAPVSFDERGVREHVRALVVAEAVEGAAHDFLGPTEAVGGTGVDPVHA
jgi:hypothetical protein